MPSLTLGEVRRDAACGLRRLRSGAGPRRGARARRRRRRGAALGRHLVRLFGLGGGDDQRADRIPRPRQAGGAAQDRVAAARRLADPGQRRLAGRPGRAAASRRRKRRSRRCLHPAVASPQGSRRHGIQDSVAVTVSATAGQGPGGRACDTGPGDACRTSTPAVDQLEPADLGRAAEEAANGARPGAGPRLVDRSAQGLSRRPPRASA